MNHRYLILDCYVDEPACLGVPPFIAPYPRLVYGALADAGVKEENITYLTIDHLRATGFHLEADFTAVFLIGGAVVPGRYLGARIGSLAEIRKIIDLNPGRFFVVGGLISHVLDRPRVHGILNDIEAAAHTLAMGKITDRRRTTAEASKWAVLGAPVVKQHPWFPRVMCEIETGRGCPRTSHCSFCSEGLLDFIEFRQEEDIHREIETLLDIGVKRFRLGRQADILQYGSALDNFNNGFPCPSPERVGALFSPLGRLRNEGRILTLNIDNGNPGTIVSFPDQSARILESIADAVSPGDTLAMGIESFDPEVISKNCLKIQGPGALFATGLVNSICGNRVNGLPRLLPGINLIHGLPGETPETFRINYNWLKAMLDKGHLLRRINIRKLQPFPGTPLYAGTAALSRAMTNRYEYYKEKIRNEIDNPMLKRIYPAGTILHDMLILETQEGFSYGKQIASYAIAAKHPVEIRSGEFVSSMVIGHQERSLLALPVPIDLNTLPARALERIPGISRKRASDIILERPLSPERIAGILATLPLSLPREAFKV